MYVKCPVKCSDRNWFYFKDNKIGSNGKIMVYKVSGNCFSVYPQA